MSLFWSLIAVPLLIALNAFFVSAEYAVVALRPAQLDLMRQSRWRRAANAMAQLKENPKLGKLRDDLRSGCSRKTITCKGSPYTMLRSVRQ